MPRRFPKRPDRANPPSPVCIVTFVDGETPPMTTWNKNGEPSLRRGIKLAHAAYESRTKRQPPAIAALHFETVDGVIVTRFPADQIAEAAHAE